MAMNFAPLDCSSQGASSEPKKIFGSHSKKWVQWPELLLYLNSAHPIQ
jgi:hypothetical protein